MVNYKSKSVDEAMRAMNDHIESKAYKQSAAPAKIISINTDFKTCDVEFTYRDNTQEWSDVPYIGQAKIGNDGLLISTKNNIADFESLILVALQ